ncbi:MAG TPA: gliding motility-associated C-terminal domain-containing protein [Bacteroidales bacterium]|nr:gliding motility-associated C-terminal domain-containing protein [Bacteroidales bacterium]
MRYFFLVTGILFSITIQAQLSAPGRNAVRFTTYQSSPLVKDQIFIYCSPSGNPVGVLSASVMKGSPPYNFSWYKWDDATKSFSNNILNSSGVTSSINNLGEGGYRLVVSGGYDTTYTAWIVFDRPAAASARVKQKLCDRLALDGDTSTAIHQFYYRDIANGNILYIKNDLSFIWSAQPVTFIPAPELLLDPVIQNFQAQPNRIYRLPVENTTFKITVNSLGCRSEASFLYEPIHVKADFSADPTKGEAPLEVTFTDKSVRANSQYTWDFGEKNRDGSRKLRTFKEDSLFIFESPFTHTYYRPGEYTVKLEVRNKNYCIDSVTLETKINVDKSKLDIPNVFTPNGDSQNDFFIVESTSLRYLKVEIFSRSGVLVYRFLGEGESLSSWQGWNGNVKETSAEASPGIYYYVIEALGWDDIKYDSKPQRGFVYLYR